MNNAGGYSPTYPANDDWRSPLELNLLSVMEAIRRALPALSRRPGCVVTSAPPPVSCRTPYDGVEYAVAKAGVIRLTTAQERAFATFTDGHNRWWPREFHIGGAELEEAVLEGREGGRWYERDVDGSECEWGKVLVWDPPSRLVLAWQISAEWAYDGDLLTEVEVRFVPEGAGRTRVEIEHRGLDAYGDQADQIRDQYDSGWPGILQAFAAAAAEA